MTEEGVRGAVARSVRLWLDRSAARFGQAHARANARQATTRLLRQRVEREDVRIYLDEHTTDGVSAAEPVLSADGRGHKRHAAGSDL